MTTYSLHKIQGPRTPGFLMKTAKTNVFRDDGIWCQATWIDGEFDTSDPIGIAADASEAEAMEAARASLADRFKVQVRRVEDHRAADELNQRVARMIEAAAD